MSIVNHKYANVLATIALICAAGIMQGCSGEDDVNCNSGTGLEAYTAGQNEGSITGTAAGNSLTYEKGKQDAYNGGYQRGHNAGYYSAQGYDLGYAQGKTTGLATGRADLFACADGTRAGDYDGEIAGIELGHHDGFEDGYDAGYDLGFVAGQFSGSCFPGGGARAAKNSDATCRDRGYDSAYNAAFANAKAANVNYNNGLRDGDTAGYTDGLPRGTSDGYTDGLDAGNADGIAQGRLENYTLCYDAAFVSSSQTAYDEVYFDLFYGYGALPFAGDPVDTGTGGQGAGFYDGYIDGQELVCGPFSATDKAQIVSRFGTASAADAQAGKLLPWAERAASGQALDRFAFKRPAFSSKAKIDALLQSIQAHRSFLVGQSN